VISNNTTPIFRTIFVTNKNRINNLEEFAQSQVSERSYEMAGHRFFFRRTKFEFAKYVKNKNDSRAR